MKGGFGGKPRYNHTKLHLEGLDEKSLKRNRQGLVSNSMSKSSFEDT